MLEALKNLETSEEAPVSVVGASCPLPGAVLMWEFECHHCQTKFETSPPRGPKEEREIKCPYCGSKEIERLNVGNLAATACGG